MNPLRKLVREQDFSCVDCELLINASLRKQPRLRDGHHLFSRKIFNQSGTTLIWWVTLISMEFCARSSDVISQGTQWRRRVALAKIVLKENIICEWSEIGTEAEFN